MDFMNFRILNGFKRLLTFEVSCLLFEISGQRFAKFAVDLTDASRQLGRRALSAFAMFSCLVMPDGIQWAARQILGTIQWCANRVICVDFGLAQVSKYRRGR